MAGLCGAPNASGLHARAALRTRQRELLLDHPQGFLPRLDLAFELRVLDSLKDFFEDRPRRVPLRDQIVAAHERRGLHLLRGSLFEHPAGHLVIGQVAVAGEAVKPVQLQVFFKAFHAQESQLSGATHAREVLEAEVVTDELRHAQHPSLRRAA